MWTCAICEKTGGEDEADEPIRVSYRHESVDLCSLECVVHFAVQKLGAMAAELRRRRDELEPLKEVADIYLRHLPAGRPQ